MGGRWRRWLVVMLLLVMAAAGAWLVYGERCLRRIGWHNNAAFPLTVAMHDFLRRREGGETDPTGGSTAWRPASAPPPPLRHWSRDRSVPSQVEVIRAYFRWYSGEALPAAGTKSSAGARSMDRVYLEEWLRMRLPETSLAPPVVEYAGGVDLAAVATALERLRNRVTGLTRSEFSGAWTPERMTEYALGMMGQVEAHLDFRAWYVGTARRVLADGFADGDEDARNCALAYTAASGDAGDGAWATELRGLLRRWGLGGYDPRDDHERPWLVCGTFFEIFSLRRFGFAPEYRGEAAAMFPVMPAVARESLGVSRFRAATTTDGLAELAKALGVYREGRTPGDWLADIAEVYDHESRLRWLRKRLQPVEAETAEDGETPETRLGEWLDRWLARRGGMEAGAAAK